MIRVVQAQTTASLFELLGCQALQRGLGRYWHEDGKIDWPMRQGQYRGSCSSCLSKGRLSVAALSHESGRTEERKLTEQRASNSKVSAGEEDMFEAILRTGSILSPNLEVRIS